MSKDYLKALNIKKAAEYLGVSVGWLYVQVEKGKIPHFRLGASPKSPIRFDLLELERWGKKNSEKTKSLDWRK